MRFPCCDGATWPASQNWVKNKNILQRHNSDCVEKSSEQNGTVGMRCLWLPNPWHETDAVIRRNARHVRTTMENENRWRSVAGENARGASRVFGGGCLWRPIRLEESASGLGLARWCSRWCQCLPTIRPSPSPLLPLLRPPHTPPPPRTPPRAQPG